MKEKNSFNETFLKILLNHVARLHKIELITKKSGIVSYEIHNLFPLLRWRYQEWQMPHDKLRWTENEFSGLKRMLQKITGTDTEQKYKKLRCLYVLGRGNEEQEECKWLEEDKRKAKKKAKWKVGFYPEDKRAALDG